MNDILRNLKTLIKHLLSRHYLSALSLSSSEALKGQRLARRAKNSGDTPSIHWRNIPSIAISPLQELLILS
jgi:hypothetical protein